MVKIINKKDTCHEEKVNVEKVYELIPQPNTLHNMQI